MIEELEKKCDNLCKEIDKCKDGKKFAELVAELKETREKIDKIKMGEIIDNGNE